MIRISREKLLLTFLLQHESVHKISSKSADGFSRNMPTKVHNTAKFRVDPDRIAFKKNLKHFDRVSSATLSENFTKIRPQHFDSTGSRVHAHTHTHTQKERERERER